MQKILLFFKRSFICLLLSFSLLCNNTAAVTYQAAAIPVAYTGWQVFVTIFALLGITLCAAGSEAEAERESAEELADKFAGWKVLKSEGEGGNNNNDDNEDDLATAFDPLDYLNGDKLTIPEEDLELWQEFVSEQKWSNDAEPISDLNLYGASIDDMSHWICDLNNIDYNLSFSGSSHLNNFLNKFYDEFVSNNYSGLFVFGPSSDTTWLYYTEIPDNRLIRFGEASDNVDWHILYADSSDLLREHYLKCTDSGFSGYGSSSGVWYFKYDNDFSDIILLINGQQYDLYKLCSQPVNFSVEVDYGTSFSLSDFDIPDNHFGDSIKDTMNSVGDSNLGPLVESGDFDVVGGGREWDDNKQQVVGDVSVTMPSPDKITDFSNGDLAYEDMLGEMDMTPVDESTGTNLLTQEFLTTQTGIWEGVKSLVDLVKNIWDFLANLIGNLIDALISMFVSLFVPSEGYFIEYFNRVDALFESALGFLYTPFDLLFGLFDAISGSSFGSTQLYFPGIKFQEYVLCEPMYVELDLRDEFPALYRYMHFITNTILIGAVLWLMQIKAKEVIKN